MSAYLTITCTTEDEARALLFCVMEGLEALDALGEEARATPAGEEMAVTIEEWAAQLGVRV